MFLKMKNLLKKNLLGGIMLAQNSSYGEPLYRKLFKELNPIAQTSAVGVVNSIINYAMYIAIPLSIIFIIYGGFQILFAKDDAKKVATGGKAILWAAIGFGIIITSKGLALIVTSILK